MDVVNALLYYHENPTKKMPEDPEILAEIEAMRKLLREKGVEPEELIGFMEKQ